MPAADVESLHIGLSSTQYDDSYLELFLKVCYKTDDCSFRR